MQHRNIAAIFFAIGLLIVGYFIIVFSQKTMYPRGAIEGNVTIGPICPVEGPGTDESKCKPTPEIYSTVKIFVSNYESDGKVILAQGYPKSDGAYRIDISAGHYWIYGKMGDSDVQMSARQEVVVETGKTTQQNIDIDTGIR